MSFKKNIKKNKCLKLAALLLSCHRLYAKVKRLSKKLDESTKDVESQVCRRLFISNTTNIYIQWNLNFVLQQFNEFYFDEIVVWALCLHLQQGILIHRWSPKYNSFWVTQSYAFFKEIAIVIIGKFFKA